LQHLLACIFLFHYHGLWCLVYRYGWFCLLALLGVTIYAWSMLCAGLITGKKALKKCQTGSPFTVTESGLWTHENWSVSFGYVNTSSGINVPHLWRQRSDKEHSAAKRKST
jgi:hypothetical protein